MGFGGTHVQRTVENESARGSGEKAKRQLTQNQLSLHCDDQGRHLPSDRRSAQVFWPTRLVAAEPAICRGSGVIVHPSFRWDILVIGFAVQLYLFFVAFPADLTLIKLNPRYQK